MSCVICICCRISLPRTLLWLHAWLWSSRSRQKWLKVVEILMLSYTAKNSYYNLQPQIFYALLCNHAFFRFLTLFWEITIEAISRVSFETFGHQWNIGHKPFVCIQLCSLRFCLAFLEICCLYFFFKIFYSFCCDLSPYSCWVYCIAYLSPILAYFWHVFKSVTFSSS